ncbi:MAG: hypothetical protein HOP29_16895 [Phycisphaerales bacterium]|nr:hypothetical protein [Phycisphaerales bacterium]
MLRHPAAWALNFVLYVSIAVGSSSALAQTGACCDGTGGCAVTTSGACTGSGGRFFTGMGCDPYPCTLDYGNCCTPHETPGCINLHPGCFSPEGVLDVACATQCQNIVCALDAKCCGVEIAWDRVCTNMAADNCLTPVGDDCLCTNPVPEPVGTAPKADPCCFSLPIVSALTPCDVPGRGCVVFGGSPACQALVCALDSFCCTNDYDATCALEARELCAVCAPAGDCAVDTLANRIDQAGFLDCVTGIGGGPVDGHCVCADLTQNGDVDVLDWAGLQVLASGSTVP